MNVVNREIAIDCVSTQLLIPSKHIVEVVNVGYAGLLGDLLGVGNVYRGSTGILKRVVGSLRGDDDFGILGLECVDSVFHIFEVGEDGLSCRGTERHNQYVGICNLMVKYPLLTSRRQASTGTDTLLGVTCRTSTFVMAELDDDEVVRLYGVDDIIDFIS